MKAMAASSPSSQTFIKIVAFSLLSFALFSLLKRVSFRPNTAQNNHLSFYNSTTAVAPVSPPPPPTAAAAAFERTGIVNELGIMTDDFIVGEFDEGLIESVVSNLNRSGANEKGKIDFGIGKPILAVEKFRHCDESVGDFVPCFSGEISKLDTSLCSENGRALDCLVPWPKGYKLHLPWPTSRDEVWFDNVPLTRLVEANGSRNWISKEGDKVLLSGHEPPYANGADQYLDCLSKMSPEIEFGQRTRVVLDVGSGVASFGAYLIGRNVTTLSIDLGDVYDNPIQIALERGLPAMLSSFGTSSRLPYSSQAFDMIHCSGYKINWTRDDGILLLEANRILRAGGYFVWQAQPVNRHEDKPLEQWKEMEDLTNKLCWELVNKKGYITIWRKPLNNTCYLARDPNARPSLCGTKENPDDIWNVKPEACITRLPENGYGANTTKGSARLHRPPNRLFTIPMDADRSRRELYKADSKYWNDIVRGYIGAFRVHKMNIRNVMDMRAGYGGFAAGLADFDVDSWVMNVVPVSAPNTLPVIFDRGLVGVMHDWCEPFPTYPRTYDWLNAAGLFSVEQRRCNITNIMLEMDRILRPGGRVYIRDFTAVVDQLQEIAKAIGWVTFMFDSGEGPHSNTKLLTAEKRL